MTQRGERFGESKNAAYRRVISWPFHNLDLCLWLCSFSKLLAAAFPTKYSNFPTIFTKVFVQSSKLVDESQIVNFIMTKNVIFTEILEFSTIFLIYRGNFCHIYKCKLSWITSVRSCFGILSLRPDSASTARRNFL